MGTPPQSSNTHPPQIRNTPEVPYIYTKNGKERVESLYGTIRAILTGDPHYESGGTWEHLLNGRRAICREPNSVVVARAFVEEHGTHKKARIVEEWRPGRGSITVIELL